MYTLQLVRITPGSYLGLIRITIQVSGSSNSVKLTRFQLWYVHAHMYIRMYDCADFADTLLGKPCTLIKLFICTNQ